MYHFAWYNKAIATLNQHYALKTSTSFRALRCKLGITAEDRGEIVFLSQMLRSYQHQGIIGKENNVFYVKKEILGENIKPKSQIIGACIS